MYRWAQVTEELKEALWELEEEKEKRSAQEEDKEDGSSMLFTTTHPSALLADKLPGDFTEVFEEKVHLDLQVHIHL